MAIPRRTSGSRASNSGSGNQQSSMPQFDTNNYNNSYSDYNSDSFSDSGLDDSLNSYPRVENPYDDQDIFQQIPVERNDFLHHDEIENETIFQDDDSYVLPNENSDYFEEEEEENYDDYDHSAYLTQETKQRHQNVKEKASKKRKNKDFVDKKNKKIVPVGGRRSAKVREFDKRKDIRKKRVLISWAFILLASIAVVYGFFSMLFPPKQLTEDEVAEIASYQTGDIGFPTEAGASFAQDFINVYLSVETMPERNNLIPYYYTGSTSASSGLANTIVSSNVKQRVLLGPTVYEKNALTPNTGSYVVGAYVETENLDEMPGGSGEDVNYVSKTYKWIFFNVNVYYNDETLSYRITPDSPTIIPNYEVKESDKLPEAAPVGNGTLVEGITNEIRPVITGFIENYSKTSSANTSAIEPYIVKDADIELMTGFNGVLTTNTNNLTFTTYGASDGSEDLRVLIKVTWEDNIDDDSSIYYTSTHIMWLTKTGDGKYLVSRFAPYYYSPNSD